MAQKISHYLLITLILALGFGQLLRFELWGIPLYFHDCLVVLLLLLNYKVWSFVIPASLKLFLAGLIIGWANAFLHYPVAQLLIPALYTFRLLAYLALYLILSHKSYLVNRQYFLLAGLTSLVIGLLQYFFLPDMRVFQYLGWDDHLNRLTLPHFDPTFSAVMLGLGLFTFPSYFPLFLVGILLSYSRSVWLSLTATLVLLIRPKKYLFLLIPILLLVIYILPKRFGEGNNLLRTYSITSRWTSDWAYVKEYKWELLIGRGFNTLSLNAPDGPYTNHATGPNNSYLYLLLTTGVLGLLGWGQFMWELYRHSPYKSMLLFFFISSLFNNVMFYPFALLWILLINSTMVPTAT